jgi:hypothetical protein
MTDIKTQAESAVDFAISACKNDEERKRMLLAISSYAFAKLATKNGRRVAAMAAYALADNLVDSRKD